jgi:ADP-ribose pyrophosphatase YjhB (NUDIX family)
MAGTMIATDVGGMRFQVRAAAVIVRDGSVLLQRAEHEPFWTLPGGRSDAGEPAEATVRRELLEETGAEVEVGRLLWVVESFFRFEGRSYHEIGWLFAARFADPAHAWMRTDAFEAQEPGVRLLYRWWPVARLDGLDVLPGFLARGLCEPPASPVHVVQRDETEWRRRPPG